MSRPLTVKILSLACLLLLLNGCDVAVPIGENVNTTIRVYPNGEANVSVEYTGTGTPAVYPVVEALVKSENEVEESSWKQVQPFNFDDAKAIFPDNFEIGFSPVGTPLRISVDSSGEILISAEAQFVTPYGVFDITTSKDIIKLSKARLLIIRIDDVDNIYELKDKEFQISFSNNDDYYRILSFEQDKKGNIQLVLESIK